MPLQNRCDPTGKAYAVMARGMFTGNRGVIHDPANKKLLGRRWTTKSWIICVCDWKGRKREVMGRNGRGARAGWTELFFLDEVTALAAGHRPCFACRRTAARLFADAFAAGNRTGKLPVAQLDLRLHGERHLSGSGDPPAIPANAIRDIPDGAIFELGGNFFAIRGGKALHWSFEGYRTPVDLAEFWNEGARPVTPASTLAALKAGYQPVWHPSA